MRELNELTCTTRDQIRDGRIGRGRWGPLARAARRERGRLVWSPIEVEAVLAAHPELREHIERQRKIKREACA